MTTIRALIAAKNRPSTQAEIDERIRYRKAAEQALAETLDRFPVLTSENFEEANSFRERRTQELCRSHD